MKKFILMMFCTFAMSTALSAQDVEVIYFHGKQRCPTCLAIETETRTTVEDELAKYVEDGSLKMSVIDYSTESGKELAKNKELAKKYKVTFSSLFVVANSGQKDESVEDFTRFAFGYARSNAVVFRDELKKKILEAIK